MANQKKMDLRQFVDQGYLQEVNRQFFHPLGLAMDIKKTGNNYEISGIWDFREVKGGIRFNPNVVESKDFIEKAKNIKDIQKVAKDVRMTVYKENVQRVKPKFDEEE